MPAGGHGLHPKIKRKEDLALHGQDLLHRKRPTANVEVLLQFRRLDLLVLGGHEKGGDAEQLILLSGDAASEAKLVGDEHGEVKSVGVVAEMAVHLHHPPHEDLPHRGSDLSAPRHEVLTDISLVLLVSGVELEFVEIGVDLGQ